jgi:hypothetical protein
MILTEEHGSQESIWHVNCPCLTEQFIWMYEWYAILCWGSMHCHRNSSLSFSRRYHVLAS